MTEGRENSLAVQAEEGLATEWAIEGLSDLEWALERCGECLAEMAENEALAEQLIARVKARLEQVNAKAARGVAFFEAAIKAYAEGHRNDLLKGGKKKSRALPGGEIGWRKKGGRLVVFDEEAAKEWALEQPIEHGLIRSKVEIDKRALQALFQASGQVPPGCDVEPETDEVYVKAEVPALRLGPLAAKQLSPEKKP